MKKSILTIILMMFTLAINAQVEDDRALETNDGAEAVQREEIATANAEEGSTLIAPDESSVRAMIAAEDSVVPYPLNLSMNRMSRPWLFRTWMPTSPFGWGYGWDLHEGLNAQIGAGVMVGFGKNNPFKGASFFTDVSLVYAKQLDSHWSVALGGTLSRFKMWDKNQWSGDVYGIANYKFNEHWSASIYAAYGNMPGGFGYYGCYTPFEMTNFNENFARVGGEVTYKFNNGNSISIGINTDIPVGGEQRPWMPQRGMNQRVNEVRR